MSRERYTLAEATILFLNHPESNTKYHGNLRFMFLPILSEYRVYELALQHVWTYINELPEDSTDMFAKRHTGEFVDRELTDKAMRFALGVGRKKVEQFMSGLPLPEMVKFSEDVYWYKLTEAETAHEVKLSHAPVIIYLNKNGTVSSTKSYFEMCRKEDGWHDLS